MTKMPPNPPPPFYRRFLAPPRTRGGALRLLAVAAIAVVVCKFLLIPFFIHGESMEPTYRDRSFGFCNTLAYRNRPPPRGEIVILAYAGRRKMLLKRVLAVEGETVRWKDGVCLIDGVPLDEPYVRTERAPWTLPPRVVGQGRIYVMGDNRSIPAEAHVGGAISLDRVVGRPLW